MLAQRIASGLAALIAAIDGAMFPQFAGAVASTDEAGVARVYHRASQLMAVVLMPLSLVMALFSREIVLVFSGNAAAVESTHTVLTLLAAGMLLHSLSHPPHYLQLACASWGLISKANVVLLLIIPLLYVAFAMRFGAVGGASVWILLNVGYLTTIPLMHRRLLRGEQWRWLAGAVALPFTGAFVPAAIAFWVRPAAAGTAVTLLYLAVASLAAMSAAAAVTPETRVFLRALLRRTAAPIVDGPAVS
jgi:O-antigen/teichoic acid export membrane protein